MIERIPLRDKIFVPVINFLLRLLTSREYRERLTSLIELGMFKALELRAQSEVTDAKLANEPGMLPDGTIVAP